MAVDRSMLEKQIKQQMERDGTNRTEAIGKLMTGAKKGAAKAQSAVLVAQEAFQAAHKRLKSLDGNAAKKEKDEIDRLERKIAAEGRLGSNENQRIRILREILKEEGEQSAE